MEEVSRWSLLVIGSCFILAVLAHGLWVSRKSSQKKREQKADLYKKPLKQTLQPKGWEEHILELDDEDLEDAQSASVFIEPTIGQDEDNDSPEPSSRKARASNDFDDLGIGTVRVVSSEESDKQDAPTDAHQQKQDDIQREFSSSLAPEALEDPKPTPPPPKIYASVVTQPKPEYAAKVTQAPPKSMASGNPSVVKFDTDFNEPPPSLLKKTPTQPEANASTSTNNVPEPSPKPVEEPVVKPKPEAEEKGTLADQARKLVGRKKAQAPLRKRREPKIAEDQMRIDFDDEPVTESTQSSDEQSSEKQGEIPQEVLVLNVKSPDAAPIAGSALLPMLLTLGFKFGDQDIFHRHVNSNGKGPVLFSLANMFKPGNFDIDNLENFTTQGISLFLILPIEGDPHQVFNMMHNAARKIADEFSGTILDGRRSQLTKQSLQQYVEKIRDFERKRATYHK